MNVRTFAFLLGTIIAVPAVALDNVPGVCQNCDGGTMNDLNNTWDNSDHSTSGPSESHEQLTARLRAEARQEWERHAPERRAEWEVQRAPTQKLVADADRLRARGKELEPPDKNSQMFRIMSAVRGAVKGKERDKDPRVLDTAWARLDCATKIAASVFETFEKSPEEALYLADEAQHALDGATKGIACTPGKPPAGYGVSKSATPAEIQLKMKQAAGALNSYESSKELSASLNFIAEHYKAAATSAAKAMAEAKAKALQAKRNGLREEELKIREIVQQQAEVHKREEERYKKIFEEQKESEKAMAAALAALKAANVFRSKEARP